MINKIYAYAERSNFIDTEHVVPLGIGISVMAIFYMEIEILKSIFLRLDNTVLLIVLISSFQGVVAGIATSLIYTAGEQSFRAGEGMKSKENALIIVLSVMLGLGYLVSHVTPTFIQSLEYTTLQLMGIVFVLGMVFVHLLVDNWRLKNEWPHILAGFLVTVAPYL